MIPQKLKLPETDFELNKRKQIKPNNNKKKLSESERQVHRGL